MEFPMSSDMRRIMTISEGISDVGPDQRAPDTFPVSGSFDREKRADHQRYGEPEKVNEKHIIATELAIAWVKIEDQIKLAKTHEERTRLEHKKERLSQLAREHKIGNFLTYIVAERQKSLK
jgi:hypothetical protein